MVNPTGNQGFVGGIYQMITGYLWGSSGKSSADVLKASETAAKNLGFTGKTSNMSRVVKRDVIPPSGEPAAARSLKVDYASLAPHEQKEIEGSYLQKRSEYTSTRQLLKQKEQELSALKKQQKQLFYDQARTVHELLPEEYPGELQDEKAGFEGFRQHLANKVADVQPEVHQLRTKLQKLEDEIRAIEAKYGPDEPQHD